jgi:hypothetical protein
MSLDQFCQSIYLFFGLSPFGQIWAPFRERPVLKHRHQHPSHADAMRSNP